MSLRKLIGLVGSVAVTLLGAGVVIGGQGISIPVTFTNGTTANALQVNQNFQSLANGALNRAGGTMTGTLNVRDIQPTLDSTYKIGDATHKFAELHVVDLTADNITGVTGDVPAGSVIFFDGVACPAGYAELTGARGRYLVGKPSGGSLGGTAGTALTNLENRATGQHDHVASTTLSLSASSSVSDPGHTHTYQHTTSGGDVTAGATADYVTGEETIATGAAVTGISVSTSVGGSASTTVNNAGSVAGTPAPYLQLLVCKKS